MVAPADIGTKAALETLPPNQHSFRGCCVTPAHILVVGQEQKLLIMATA
jgi:hypothetical protein